MPLDCGRGKFYQPGFGISQFAHGAVEAIAKPLLSVEHGQCRCIGRWRSRWLMAGPVTEVEGGGRLAGAIRLLLPTP